MTEIFSVVSAALIAKMLAEDLGLQSLRSTVDIDAAHCSKSSHECSNGAEQTIHRPHIPNEGPYKPKVFSIMFFPIALPTIFEHFI